MAAAEIKVALVGDSVLDNHYWLSRPEEDIREQTERKLKTAHPSRNVQVLNFAVDESTVSCVLRGRAPASQYKNGRREAGMEPYPTDADGVVRPLPLLRNAKPTHVVGKCSFAMHSVLFAKFGAVDVGVSNPFSFDKGRQGLDT